MAVGTPPRQRKKSFALFQLLALVGACGWLGFNIWLLQKVFEPKGEKGGNSKLSDGIRGVKSFVGHRELVRGSQEEAAADKEPQRAAKTPHPAASIGRSSLRLHGTEVGLREDGTRHYVPKEMPPAGVSMSMALRAGGGFNLRLSDALTLDRNVTDSRDSECKSMNYALAPSASATVVIVFFNEPFSTLMRSVHSVLHRTPPEILEEIVLVDDGSNLDWIRAGGSGELEEYIKILNRVANVNLVRLPVRKGIVGARMAGIRAAKAPIFVILDSHVEVQVQWLEPLIARIHEDRRRVLMPQIDGIDPETFNMDSGGIGCTLGFLWKLMEHAFNPSSDSPPERRNAKRHEFVSSPTMAGGLFAADRKFFLEVGGYDEQFSYWGTENLELSFRLWMCGGILECAPCSRVYHIFRRGGVGYSSPFDAVVKNKMRLLTIWMDEYADLAWRVIGKPRIDFGTYKENLKWREERQCKSFRWFLEEINTESTVKRVPEDVPYLGNLKNRGAKMCLDIGYNDVAGGQVSVNSCNDGNTQQFMYFRNPKLIMPVINDETCIGHDVQKPSVTGWCNRQRWDVLPETGQLKHVQSGKCFSTHKEGGRDVVDLSTCDATDLFQQWDWPLYDPPTVFTPPQTPRLRGQKGGHESNGKDGDSEE